MYYGEWLRGRALAWGARDRGFDSRLPDHLILGSKCVRNRKGKQRAREEPGNSYYGA